LVAGGHHRAPGLAREPGGDRRVTRLWRQRLAAAGLLAPALALVVAVFVIPSLDLFRLSLAWMDPQLSIHYDLSLVNYTTMWWRASSRASTLVNMTTPALEAQ